MKKHSPLVGTNLQDQVSVFLGPFFTHKWKSLVIDRDLSTSVPQLWGYAAHGGPLTTTGYEAAAMLPSLRNPAYAAPNLQLTMYGIGHHKSAGEDFSHAYGVKRQLTQSYFQSSKGRDSFSILVSATRPKSRGFVWLKDSNPYSPPIVHPHYLENPHDVHTLIDGIHKSLFLVEGSTTFRTIGAKFTKKKFPGCEDYPFRSNAYWECYVRIFTVSVGGLAGTIPMGQSYEFGVVNSELQVFGVERLRVIDASVMPNIVSSSPEAATMLIAEKGADMILNRWGHTAPREEFYKEAQNVAVSLQQIVQDMKNTDLKYPKDIPYLNPTEEEDISKEEELNINLTAPPPLKDLGGLKIKTVNYLPSPIETYDPIGNSYAPQLKNYQPSDTLFEGHDNYLSSESKVVSNQTAAEEENSDSNPNDFINVMESTENVDTSELINQFFLQLPDESHERVNISESGPTTPVHSQQSVYQTTEKEPSTTNPHKLGLSTTEKLVNSLKFWTTSKPSYKDTVNSIISLSLPLISKPNDDDIPAPRKKRNSDLPKELGTTTLSPLTSFRQAFSPLVKLLRGVPTVDQLAKPFQNISQPFTKMMNSFKQFRTVTEATLPNPLAATIPVKTPGKIDSSKQMEYVIASPNAHPKLMKVSVNVKGTIGTIHNKGSSLAQVQPTYKTLNKEISTAQVQSTVNKITGAAESNVPFPYAFVLKPASKNSSDPHYLYFPNFNGDFKDNILEIVPPDYELINDDINEAELAAEKGNVNEQIVSKGSNSKFQWDFSLASSTSKSVTINRWKKSEIVKLPFHTEILNNHETGLRSMKVEVKAKINSYLSGFLKARGNVSNTTSSPLKSVGEKEFVRFADSPWAVTRKYENDTISFNMKILKNI